MVLSVARKTFIKNFEDYRGVDQRSTPLTSEINSAVSATNYSYAESRSIKGTTGFQKIGQAGNFTGLSNHSYFDTISGLTVETPVAISNQLWKIKTSSLTITRVAGSASWSITISRDATTPEYRLVLTQGGVPVTFGANPYLSLGTGMEVSPVTMLDVRDQIDALANFTVAMPERTARVNGAQVLVNAVVVDAGHTVAVGDNFPIYDLNTPGLEGKIITASAAALITFLASFGAVTVADNQVIGVGAVPAATLPIGTYSPVDPVLTLDFYYWEWVEPPQTDNVTAAYQFPNIFGQSFTRAINDPANFIPTSFANAENILYIANSTPIYGASDTQNQLYKYDGNKVYRAGMPNSFIVSATVGGAGAVDAGGHSYITTFQHIDRQNRVIQGTQSSTRTVTLAVASVVDLAIQKSSLIFTGFDGTYARVNGNQVGASTITVVAGHRFEVNDRIFIMNRVTTPTTPYEGRVTAKTSTTITIQPVFPSTATIVTVNNNDFLLRGLRCQIWRSKVGGNIYYLVNEVTFDPTSVTDIAFQDTVADTALGAEFDEPEIGREPDPPPRPGIVTTHQGLLVLGRNYESPETIYYSLPDNIEGFPVASNSFNVPPTVKGTVTAIASDTQDRLIVCKENAIYDVVGDLDGASFSIRPLKEGDYGISSQASIARVDGMLIGVGRLGFVGVSSGRVVTRLGESVGPAIWNNNNLLLAQATSFNDYTARQYICYIPSTESITSGANNLNALCYSFDYSNEEGAWFDNAYTQSFAPHAGFMISGNLLWHCSRNYGTSFEAKQAGHVFKSLLVLNDAQKFAQHILPITNTYTTEWETLGEPSIDKSFLKLVVYSFPGQYSDSFPFSLATSVYLNYNDTTPLETFTLTFSGTASDYVKIHKLKSTKAKAIQFKFVSNTLHQSPFLSGIELIVASSYDKEDIKR